jgi:DNA polymerase-3 subunit alpha
VERDNTEKLSKYLADARRMEIEVLPPDINLAGLDFSIEGEAGGHIIRYGMAAIKNAGEGAVQLILDERENGPYKDLEDLCNRVDLRRVGKRALESMIKVGVLDRWGTRRQLLDALDRMIGFSGQINEAASVGQMSLFGGLTGTDVEIAVELLRPESSTAPLDHRQLLDWEKELIGVYLSEHPLERALDSLKNGGDNGYVTTADLDANSHGKSVKLAGIVSHLRTHTTRKGDAMAFATLEDLQGKADLLFFPRSWKQCRDQVKVDQILVVSGTVQLRDESVTVIVDNVQTDVTIAQDADADVQTDGFFNEELDENGNGRDLVLAASPGSFDPAVDEVLLDEDSPYGAPPPPASDDVYMAMTAPAISPPLDENGIAREGPLPERVPTSRPVAPSIADNGKKTVVVEIKLVSSWRDSCRKALELAGRFAGEDALRLCLTGNQRLTMEFPNQQTRYCPELLESLRLVPGILRVFVA